MVVKAFPCDGLAGRAVLPCLYPVNIPLQVLNVIVMSVLSMVTLLQFHILRRPI